VSASGGNALPTPRPTLEARPERSPDWAGQPVRVAITGWYGAVVFELQRVVLEPGQLAEPFGASVTVFPGAIELDTGVYSPLAVELTHALQAEGVDADFAHQGNQRVIRGRLFGELIAQLAIGFGEAVAGAGAWAGLVAAFRLVVRELPDDQQRVRVRLMRQRTNAAGSTETVGVEYDGPLRELPEALGQLTWPSADSIHQEPVP
jgi:hypothetical protein